MMPTVDDGLQLESASDVSSAFTRMFGRNALLPQGIVHVAAVAACDGKHLVIRVGNGAPSSRHDLFVLGAVRARAEAVVATGEILRSEPSLRHDRYGPGDLHAALLAWRRKLGLDRPPRSLILTSGRNVDHDHALFSSATAVSIITGEDAPRPFILAMRARGVDVLQVESPSVRAAIGCLQKEYGVTEISIEAGPSSTKNLYAVPVAVRELFLSVFHGRVQQEHLVAQFADPAVQQREFQEITEPYQVGTGQGTWSFHRLKRIDAHH